ncbi:MAG: hypothetical protein AB1697_04925 [Pseudomonadota bacterium]
MATADRRVYLRLTGEELALLNQEASAAGLPVATLAKLKILGSLERDRLASQMEQQAESERTLRQKEIAALVAIKTAVFHVARTQGIDTTAIDAGAKESAARLILEAFGGSEE